MTNTLRSLLAGLILTSVAISSQAAGAEKETVEIDKSVVEKQMLSYSRSLQDLVKKAKKDIAKAEKKIQQEKRSGKMPQQAPETPVK